MHILNLALSVVREHIIKRVTRSSEWPTVRKHFLESHPKCEACGGTTQLQVHHKMPFHDDPSLELHPDNLISLCMGPRDCHIKVGHGDSFKWYNPNVEADAAELLASPDHLDAVNKRAESARKPNQPGE
jgi:hypothetical protein